MSLLELRGVSKGFFADSRKTRATIALRDLNLSIEEGEFVSLIGPSGCGKTVALGIMAGFTAPSEGTALFRGAPIEQPGPERGVVFQEYSLLPWLSVRQNIVFALRNAAKARKARFDAEDARKRADEALAAVGLRDAGELRPNTLSGGMKQRVAIARLLAMDSDVFLMDEPFSALDEQTRAALDASLFRLWRARRKTIVFVTHNISEAVLVSSRIVLLSQPPGHVLHEWSVPPELERDLSSPHLQRLSDEIRSLLPTSACSFAEERCEAKG